MKSASARQPSVGDDCSFGASRSIGALADESSFGASAERSGRRAAPRSDFHRGEGAADTPGGGGAGATTE